MTTSVTDDEVELKLGEDDFSSFLDDPSVTPLPDINGAKWLSNNVIV